MKKNIRKDHSSYEIRLNNLAVLSINLRQFDNALALFSELLKNTKENLGEKHPKYVFFLHNLATLYSEMDQYEKALNIFYEVLGITEETLGINHPDYLHRLKSLGILYVKMGQYDKALPLHIEVLDKTEKTLGKEHPDYIAGLNSLGILYHKMGQYDRALPRYLEALEITEKILGKTHPDYSFYLNGLASLYKEMGQVDKALSLYLKALESIEKGFGKQNLSITQMGLATMYSSMGQNKKALKYFIEAKESIEDTYGKDHYYYIDHVNGLAIFFSTIGQYDKALPLYLEALEKKEKSVGKEHPDFNIMLGNVAYFYQTVGQYEKALPMYIEAMENIEKSLGKEHPDYGYITGKLATLYENIGQYDKAFPLYIESSEIIEKVLGKNHSSYGIALNNLAVFYRNRGQLEKALPLYNEALLNTEKTLGKNHFEFGIRLGGLAKTYEGLKQYDNALNLYLEALQNTESVFGKEHPDYGFRLNNLAGLYENMGLYAKALPIYMKALDNVFTQLLQAFSFMSEKEKEQFQKTVGFNFSAYLSFLNRYSSEKPEVVSHAFDIELATKGMILQSGIESREVILQSGNQEAITQFEEWSILRNILAKQYSQPIAERRKDIREVEDKAEKIEAELSRTSAQFRDGREFAKIRWQDVQKALQSGETAIEFAFFQYYNGKEWTDSTLYTALLLRHDNPRPVLVSLCEQRQLDSVLNRRGNTEAGFISALYRGAELEDEGTVSYGKRLYELVWAPLEKHLNAGDRIFFSPSGSLHQISFAAIPTGEGKYLSDVYRLEQLSTTAMLAREKNEPFTPNDLVLFGGISYDEAAEEQVTSNPLSMRSLPENLERGGSWKYLPGTKAEVEAIHASAKPRKVNVHLYEGKEATEERYKALSGKNSPQILHIATHGFFFPDPLKEKPKEGFISEDKQVFRSSDNPLNRSGLLFAGANRVWQGEQMPEGREDGILTAYEATGVILQNTKLVVLSACETGLGDIKGSEGVFGLQRAFKAAGAEYLLMSLWKVPDRETAEFMNAFYERLFAGKYIPDAFRETQTLMRKNYPEEPYKWAAFVLVR